MKYKINRKKKPFGSYVNRYPINEVPILSSSIPRLVKKISKLLAKDAPITILTCTTYGLYRSTQNNLLKEALVGSDIVVPDGMPLVWILMSKRGGSERIYGPDLMLSICQALQNTSYSHYFYGSTKGTVLRLVKNMINKYPNINIAGHYSPGNLKIGQKESKHRIKKISKTKPSIVWVGLGEEKQDIWIHLHKKYFPHSIIIGVGAAFDFLADTKHQAPLYVQRIGLEWLFRLYQEPKRLWKRYLLSALFLIKLLFKSR